MKNNTNTKRITISAPVLQVGHHYRLANGIGVKNQQTARLWSSPTTCALVGHIQPEDSSFFVVEERLVKDGTGRISGRKKRWLVSWKVMTPRQEMGWLVFTKTEWERIFSSWFERVL